MKNNILKYLYASIIFIVIPLLVAFSGVTLNGSYLIYYLLAGSIIFPVLVTMITRNKTTSSLVGITLLFIIMNVLLSFIFLAIIIRGITPGF